MYFTIESASGGYRAHAYGDNNRLIFWTQVYSEKSSAENAIRVMKTEAKTATATDRS
jgi:uncharacterized protein YegP (UPF0339 family)